MIFPDSGTAYKRKKRFSGAGDKPPAPFKVYTKLPLKADIVCF